MEISIVVKVDRWAMAMERSLAVPGSHDGGDGGEPHDGDGSGEPRGG